MSEPKAQNIRPSLPVTIMTVAGIVPFIGVLMWIYQGLGIHAPFFGFIFLLYWMAIQHQEASEYLRALLGGLCGVGFAWILLSVPGMFGVAGFVLALGLTASILFLYTRQQAQMVINNSTMLFLAVAAIPDLKVTQNAPSFAASLLVGALYSGACVASARWIGRWRLQSPISGDQAPQA